jgi:ketosteroid isomerase-like protein
MGKTGQGAAAGAASLMLREGYEAFGRGDVATVMAMFDSHIEWNTPDTVRFGGTYNGRDGVAEFFGHLAELYDDLAVIPERFIEQGDEVVVRGTLSGRPPEGVMFQLPFVHCWELTDGLASRFTEFYDTVRLNAALGLDQPINLNSAVPTQAKAPGAAARRDA